MSIFSIKHDRVYVLFAVLSAVLAILALSGPRPAVAATVSVKDFGAVGDGQTDDTQALCNASGQVAASGGTLTVPAGVYIFDPTVCKIKVGNNTAITGTGTIKIKNGVGNYNYIISAATPATYVQNVTISGLTIDQNTYNTSATVSVSDASTIQVAVLLYNGNTVDIGNVTVKSSGVDAFLVDGQNINIHDNRLVFQRRAAQAPFDNSGVYINGSNFTVQNNTCTGNSGEIGETCLEMHGGPGTISGNTSDWYNAVINAVDFNSVAITKNTSLHSESGIKLWTITGHASNGVVVDQNTISLNNKDRLSSVYYGIAFARDSAFQGPFANATITANSVIMQVESPGRAVSNSFTFGIGITPLGSVSHVLVANNTLTNPTNRGIFIGYPGNGSVISDVLVTGNTITDSGNNSETVAHAYGAGVALNGNLQDVTVSGNFIIETQNPFAGNYSIYGYDTGSTFTRVKVTQNYVKTSTGQYALLLPASVDTTGGATTSVPPDITAPVISAVASSAISSTSTVISWVTDEPADSRVDYGTTSNYGYSSQAGSALVSSHSAALSGLSAATTYHYRAVSKDAAGNAAASQDFTFTTSAAPKLVGDINLDGVVNSLDYSIMNQHWNQNYLPADLYHDSIINSLDFVILKNNWLKTLG